MKTWSILFAALAILCLIAIIAGHTHQLIMFFIAAAMSGICWLQYRKDRNSINHIEIENNED